MIRTALNAAAHAALICLVPGMGWLFLSGFTPMPQACPEPALKPVRIDPPYPEGPGCIPFYPPALPVPRTCPEAALPPVGRDWSVPRWIVAGILAQETKSTLRPDDSIRYVDKRRGAAGERGPTQLKRIAFDQVKRPGEAYWRVETDLDFALDITERYLLWLRKQTGSWREAIQAYNAGLGGRGCSAAHAYYSEVREKAR